jgi:serine/threonine protein phosphatase PrpC
MFRSKKTAESSVRTAPLSVEQLDAVSDQIIKYSPPQLVYSVYQSTGLQRDHNEDTLFAFSSILGDGRADIPFGVFIVADGMGGHQHGEAASGAAARTMGGFLLNKLSPRFLGGNSDDQGESIQELMELGVKEAQRNVVRNAPGGGTTLTTALVIGEQVTVAHVGDSRLYFLYPDGRIKSMTEDHSLVQRLKDLGQLSEKEASTYPQRNVLYRALGQTEPFKPDIKSLLFPHPGFMLICSDGLWGVVPESEIVRIVNTSANPQMACYELVSLANANGGPDNISVILVQYLS